MEAHDPGEGTSGGPPPPPPPPRGRGSRKAKWDADNAKKDEVAAKVATGEYILELIDEGSPHQSPAWQKFARVYTKEKAPLPFVKCRNAACGVVKMLTSGRGGLADHKCKTKTEARAPVQPEAKNQFLTDLVGMCVGRLLPSCLTDADEFRQLIQTAINIGADCGKISAAEIVPSRNTLCKIIGRTADSARQFFINKYKKDIQDGLVSGTVDGWDGGSQRRRKFFTQTLSAISEDFEMSDAIIFTTHVNAKSVTAPVIREAVDENFERLTLPAKSVHEVTDDGSDIVAAMSDRSRSYCMDHCLHLVVKRSLKPQLTSLDLFGEVGGNVVDNVTKAVRLLKSRRERRLTALKSKLKPPPATKRDEQRIFKSSLPMLRSVANNFNSVKQALDSIGHGAIFSSLTADLVKDTINVLEPIERLAARKNNTFKASQLNEVIALTSSKDGDSETKKKIKEHIHGLLVPILKILQVIRKCKETATFIKTSGMNEHLTGGSLKQEVDTRWMSLLSLLRSFFVWPMDETTDEPPSQAKIEQVNGILVDKKREDILLGEHDIQIMLDMISILRPFEKAIVVLEAAKVPTIQHVIPRYMQLQRHLRPRGNDTFEMAAFREELSKQLEIKVAPNISMRHKMGLFFWPKFASLPNMSEEERSEVVSAVRTLVAEQDAIVKRRLSESTAEGPQPSSAPKRRRRTRRVESDAEYDSLIPSDEDGGIQQQACNSELDTYILLQDTSVKSTDILSWWRERVAMFPVLSRVARMVLATPASSAAVERAFSAAGRLINNRRTCLTAEHVDDFLLLHDFLRKVGLVALNTFIRDAMND